MKNKELLKKIVFIGLIVLILLSLVAPAIFAQSRPAPAQERLLNGLRILLWPDKTSEKVEIRVRVHAGSAFDPQGKEGVMQLLADNIFPNEAARDYFVEDMGGSLDVVANYDYMEVRATAKADSFLSVLETIANAVANPAIDREQTETLKKALIAKLTQLEADPYYVVDNAVAARLFGTFPYGRPEDGTTETISKIDFADLVEAKQRFLTADNATVAISGNFDRSLALQASRRYFGAWLKSDRKVPSTFRAPDEPSAAPINVSSTRPDATGYRMAIRGAAFGDADHAASAVFAKILETRLRSRVPAGSAEKVSVRNEPHRLPGVVVIGFDGAVTDANEILKKAMQDAVTDAEFRSAKNDLVAKWNATETQTFWLDADSFVIAKPETLMNAADKVTLADVSAFAAKLRARPIAYAVLTVPQK